MFWPGMRTGYCQSRVPGSGGAATGSIGAAAGFPGGAGAAGFVGSLGFERGAAV
jgi:hypothetical protein